MIIVRGIVKTNVDRSGRGRVKALFPKLTRFRDEPQWVTYTSPFYKVNGGGFAAIPDVDDEILAAYDESGPEDERFYYHSTVVRRRSISSHDLDDPTSGSEKEDFDPLRVTDSKAKIYGSKGKPKAMTVTNSAGAGLLINREFSKRHIQNDVTLKGEGSEEVNVGTLGVQIKNNQGDQITLSSGESNDVHGYRSLFVETEGDQRHRCLSGNYKLKIKDGGDINIENDSTGTQSLAYQLGAGVPAIGFEPPPTPTPGAFPWAGNVRLKSRHIDLAALGEFSTINIITNNGRIVVDNLLGKIDVVSNGNINLESKTGDINLNAPNGSVNLYSGSQQGGVNVDAQNQVSVRNLNGTLINNIPLGYLPVATGPLDVNTLVLGQNPIPIVPQTFIPNDYNDGILDENTKGAK